MLLRLKRLFVQPFTNVSLSLQPWMDSHPPQGFHQRRIGGRHARQRRVSNTAVRLSYKTPLSPCKPANNMRFWVCAKIQVCNPQGFDRFRPQHAAPSSTTAAPTLQQRSRSYPAPTTAQGSHSAQRALPRRTRRHRAHCAGAPPPPRHQRSRSFPALSPTHWAAKKCSVDDCNAALYLTGSADARPPRLTPIMADLI